MNKSLKRFNEMAKKNRIAGAIERLQLLEAKGENIRNRASSPLEAAHQLEAYLRDVQFANVETGFAEGCGSSYVSGAGFRFRITQDAIEVGVAGHFDRWANSRHFEVTPVPREELTREAMLLALADAVDAKKYQREFDDPQFDLAPSIRAYRRLLMSKVAAQPVNPAVLAELALAA